MPTHADATDSMNSDFEELLKALNASGVKYLVVDGYAVMLYTEPRYTKGLDVWVETSEQNAGAVDILMSIAAVRFEDAWPNRTQSRLGNEAAGFIGRDDLVKNKRASGRHIDLHDAELLE